MQSSGLYEKLLLLSKVFRLQHKIQPRREKNDIGALSPVMDEQEDIVTGQDYSEEADAEEQSGESGTSIHPIYPINGQRLLLLEICCHQRTSLVILPIPRHSKLSCRACRAPITRGSSLLMFRSISRARIWK